MAMEPPPLREQSNPLVIKGHEIKEITVCNIATEPVTRIYIPDGGTLIVELHEPGQPRDSKPIILQPGYADRKHVCEEREE